MIYIFTRKPAELKKFGYKTIHLFKNIYLVRRYSVDYKKFSLYSIVIFKGGVE